MKVAIAGFGLTEGVSALKYWKDLGNEVVVLDQDEAIRGYLEDNTEVRISEDVFDDVSEFDLVVRTPSLSPQRLASAKKITSVSEEFFEKCPASIIGVTGTKGKGTTASLIADIFKKDNKTVHLIGNIGVSALDSLEHIQADDFVVYELSSFQLWDLQHSPETAIVLMIEPEHLDVHSSMDEYIEAKSNISSHQDSNGLTIYHPINKLSEQIAMHGSGKKIKYLSPEGAYVGAGVIGIDSKDICRVDEVQLLGKHNLENITAAITAFWAYSQNVEAVRDSVKNFKGLEHRLEIVRELDGVTYYNDSFATTPSTSVAAINSFEQNKILILGGSDKGSEYNNLAQQIAGSNVKTVLLVGQMADKIRSSLDIAKYEGEIITQDLNTIEQIVAKAKEKSSDGDVVLLSPACASFDMFDNYKDRGDKFKLAVNSL